MTSRLLVNFGGIFSYDKGKSLISYLFIFMGRKTKYNKELKLEIIRRYFNGEPALVLTNDYDCKGAADKYSVT